MQHFCLYPLGTHFTIKLRMDHSSLTWFWKFKEPEGQLARWLERLQEILLSSTDLARDILMLMLYPGCLVINVAERPTYRHRLQKRLLPWCLLSCAEVNLHEVSLRDLQLADSCRCGTHPQREGQWSETTTFEVFDQWFQLLVSTSDKGTTHCQGWHTVESV